MGGFVGAAKQVPGETASNSLPGTIWPGPVSGKNQVRAKARLQDPDPAGDGDHLHPFVLHLPLGPGGEHGNAVGALRLGGRGLPGICSGVQPFGGGLGRPSSPCTGIAVETGVVMVMLLHEALDRKLMDGPCTEQDIVRNATFEGAVLRLRPKLMTVAGIALLGLVARSLWSDRELGRT